MTTKAFYLWDIGKYACFFCPNDSISGYEQIEISEVNTHRKHQQTNIWAGFPEKSCSGQAPNLAILHPPTEMSHPQTGSTHSSLIGFGFEREELQIFAL